MTKMENPNRVEICFFCSHIGTFFRIGSVPSRKQIKNMKYEGINEMDKYVHQRDDGVDVVKKMVMDMELNERMNTTQDTHHTDLISDEKVQDFTCKYVRDL